MPTLEVELLLDNGIKGTGLVPSGASTGQFEALEMRDAVPAMFKGKSVYKAIKHVQQDIADVLIGQDASDQRVIDQIMIELDGTSNKARLGANAILGVSMALARALAASDGIPLYQHLTDAQGNLLPLPEIQIIGGGAHANWRTDVQDFLIIATGAKNYTESLEITFNIYHVMGEILKQRGLYYGLADEVVIGQNLKRMNKFLIY